MFSKPPRIIMLLLPRGEDGVVRALPRKKIRSRHVAPSSSEVVCVCHADVKRSVIGLWKHRQKGRYLMPMYHFLDNPEYEQFLKDIAQAQARDRRERRELESNVRNRADGKSGKKKPRKGARS